MAAWAAPMWAEGTASTRGVPIKGPKAGLFYWVKSGASSCTRAPLELEAFGSG